MVGHREAESRESEDRVRRSVVLRGRAACKQVLVVSDLHLGSGREPDTGRYRPRENFFADDAFRRFLEYHAEDDAGPGLLVPNGDIIDFVRVVGVPRTDEEFADWCQDLDDLGYQKDRGDLQKSVKDLQKSVNCVERLFGLRTSEHKSVWRVRRVIQGHSEFFRSLGWWLEEGGRIVFVKGNHDLELEWPLVRETIRQSIARTACGPGVVDRLGFSARSVRIENLYIEHGHRFDPATAVYGRPFTRDGREIRLPLAAVVSRYLINKLEEIEPFLNNVKPIERALRTIVLRHPWRCLWYSLRASFFVCRSFRPYWLRHGIGVLVFFGALAAPLVVVGLLVPAVYSALVMGPAMIEHLPAIAKWLAFLAIAAVIIEAMARRVFRKRKFPDAEDSCGQKLFEDLRGTICSPDTEIAYGVIGHTHRPDVQVLDRGENRRHVYLNSGTWAPNWRDKRSNLRVGTEFSFLRFDWKPKLGEYRHRSLVWRDDRGDRGEPVDNVVMARSRSTG